MTIVKLMSIISLTDKFVKSGYHILWSINFNINKGHKHGLRDSFLEGEGHWKQLLNWYAF